MLRTSAVLLFTGILLSASAQAQVVRGTIVDRDGLAGIPGVIVALSDTSGSDVVRVLSNERGEFNVRVPAAGSYRLRVLRIGYEPTDTLLTQVRADEVRTIRLAVTGAPIRLRAVEVTAKSACVGRTDPDVQRLWEEARKALIATTLTRSQRSYDVRIATFERALDPRGAPTRAQTLVERVGRSTKPFTSVPLEQLAIEGYVVPDRADLIYRAPDAEILASNGFAAAYCLRIAGDSASKPGVGRDLLGLGFSPANRRRNSAADIAGTLWIDRETAELRALAFHYTGLPQHQADFAGGRVEFTRLPDGAWLVDRWTIHMPVHRPNERRGQPPVLSAMLVNGGAILRLQRGAAVVHEGGTMLTGTVRDARGEAVSGARIELLGAGREAVADSAGRFMYPMVVDGRHIVRMRTALLDSLGAPPVEAIIDVKAQQAPAPLNLIAPRGQIAIGLACRDARAESEAGIGMVHGIVRTAAGAPAAGARVRVIWQEVSPRRTSQIEYRPISLEAVTNPDGTYRVCGVPRLRDLRIDATGAGAPGPALPLVRRIEGNAVLLKQDIALP